MTNLERLDSRDIKKFADNVVIAWGERDEAIRKSDELLKGQWRINVPAAFEATAKQQHSHIPDDVLEHALGAVTANEPVFSRSSPDEDLSAKERATTVARYCQARYQYDNRTAVAAESAFRFVQRQMLAKGAACVSSVFKPHAWASVPSLFDQKGLIDKKYWRGSDGKAVEEEDRMDLVATSKHYKKIVDQYRVRAEDPIEHRFPQMEQNYPVFVGRALVGWVVSRKASLMELAACRFDTSRWGDDTASVQKSLDLMEVWMPNTVRYFLSDEEVFHLDAGQTPIRTRYGFVPFAYRVGMSATQGEFGPWGRPILNLVDRNIRMIDTLETFRLNAIHVASFTSFQLVDTSKTDAVTVTSGTGVEQQTWSITPGVIQYFGPNKEIRPLLHPGLNKDFDKAIQDERTEIRRIIPDILTGMGESSGYNSALAGNKAMSFFNGPVDGCERLYEDLSVMDMKHIETRVPGPIYLDYAWKRSDLDGAPPKVSRTRIEASDVDGYHGITVSISREVDVITKGTWAQQVVAQGLQPVEWFYEVIGEKDPELRRRQLDVEEFLRRPDVKEYKAQKALQAAGLLEMQKKAAALQRFQQGADGTWQVQMPDGSYFGPGQSAAPPGAGMPQMQGAVGAAMGGANPAVMGSNMNSTNTNPNIGVPTPEQPIAARRKGGAIPGAPQKQGWGKSLSGA